MDKLEERQVVEMVFGSKPNISIEGSECPDFICRVPGNIEFGIEVTDFFLSESDARLMRIPGYRLELLKSKSYRHKDDKQGVRLEKIIYRSKNTGEEREVDAIIRESHTIDDVLSRVRASIESKTGKAIGYSTDITDLIIRDVESIARFENIQDLIRAIYRTKMCDAVLKQGFREIYLVTTNNTDWVCVPLKANLFVGEVLKLQRLFREYYGSKIESFTPGKYLVELARHLVSRFGTIEYEVPEEENPRLIYGSVGVGYCENQGLEIFDVSFDGTTGRKVVEFDDRGDVELNEFVRAEVAAMFACAPIFFPAIGAKSSNDTKET
jgi:hypothetical protein